MGASSRGKNRSRFDPAPKKADHRDEHQPAEQSARQHLSRDAGTDDVTDSQEGRIDVDPDHGVFKVGDLGFHFRFEQLEPVAQGLHQSSRQEAAGHQAGVPPSRIPGFQHFGAGRSLGIRQGVMFVHDQQAAEGHHHEHAQKSARQDDEDDHRLTGGKVPEEKGGQGEHGSRSDRLPGGGHGLHDVVFQDRIPPEKPPQDSHRDHGGGDRCRHGHPDFSNRDRHFAAPNTMASRIPSAQANRVSSGNDFFRGYVGDEVLCCVGWIAFFIVCSLLFAYLEKTTSKWEVCCGLFAAAASIGER